ncbi:hypothetical protein HK097_011361 [Rhizophlyctis rosea]|uniref:Uncharacterized protein n=1 Tax=Rhizophlyctis rosea TaxID=64517 RepID=A0AAD5S9H8_9FUNG|nr:hypothetical protein HK097_011361 [Rhizophlyctis rosea]
MPWTHHPQTSLQKFFFDGMTSKRSRHMTDNMNKAIRDGTFIYNRPYGLKTFSVNLSSPHLDPVNRPPVTGDLTMELSHGIREFCEIFILLRKTVSGRMALNEDLEGTRKVIWTNPQGPLKESEVTKPDDMVLGFELEVPQMLEVDGVGYQLKVGIQRIRKGPVFVLRDLVVKVGDGTAGPPLPEYVAGAEEVGIEPPRYET